MPEIYVTDSWGVTWTTARGGGNASWRECCFHPIQTEVVKSPVTHFESAQGQPPFSSDRSRRFRSAARPPSSPAASGGAGHGPSSVDAGGRSTQHANGQAMPRVLGLVSQPHAPMAPCPPHAQTPIPLQWVSKMGRSVRRGGRQPYNCTDQHSPRQ